MNATAFAYAEVIVAAGDVRGDQTFHYSVPDSLRGKLRPGQLVMAPFGARQLPGIVTALAKRSPVEGTRDLLQVVWEPPLIGSRQLALARWVAARYGAPLRSSLDLVGPPRLVNHLHAEFTAVEPNEPGRDLTRSEQRVLDLLREHGALSQAALHSKLGKTAATRGVRDWCDWGWRPVRSACAFRSQLRSDLPEPCRRQTENRRPKCCGVRQSNERSGST